MKYASSCPLAYCCQADTTTVTRQAQHCSWPCVSSNSVRSTARSDCRHNGYYMHIYRYYIQYRQGDETDMKQTSGNDTHKNFMGRKHTSVRLRSNINLDGIQDCCRFHSMINGNRLSVVNRRIHESGNMSYHNMPKVYSSIYPLLELYY